MVQSNGEIQWFSLDILGWYDIKYPKKSLVNFPLKTAVNDGYTVYSIFRKHPTIMLLLTYPSIYIYIYQHYVPLGRLLFPYFFPSNEYCWVSDSISMRPIFFLVHPLWTPKECWLYIPWYTHGISEYTPVYPYFCCLNHHSSWAPI